MNELPLISVIVPAFNASEYVERCVRSVQNQIHDAWELILIDDGSTDDTLDKMLKMEKDDSRISVKHTENRGVCSARNCGLDMAKGEWIAFLDADDELDEHALEKLYQNAIEYSVDISIGQMKSIDMNGEINKGEYPRSLEIWGGQEGLINSLEDHPATYSAWGKLYKKSIIDKTRFYEGKRVHEDSFFLFELLCKNPSVVIKNDYIYLCHLTTNSASRCEFSDKFLDILFFLDKKKAIIEEKYPSLKEYIPNLIIKANMALLNNLSNTTNAKYRKIEYECYREVIRYKRNFKAATRHNKKFFWIISHHLYYPYKIAKMLKQNIYKCRLILQRKE